MNPAFHASARHWLAGLVLAAAGVVLARVVAPLPEFPARTRAAVALVGQLVALAGLFVIVLGIRRRLRLAAAAAGPKSAND